jgi:hypothetical protein
MRLPHRWWHHRREGRHRHGLSGHTGWHRSMVLAARRPYITVTVTRVSSVALVHLVVRPSTVMARPEGPSMATVMCSSTPEEVRSSSTSRRYRGLQLASRYPTAVGRRYVVTVVGPAVMSTLSMVPRCLSPPRVVCIEWCCCPRPCQVWDRCQSMC